MVAQDCKQCSVFEKSFPRFLSRNDIDNLNEKKSLLSYKKGQAIFTSGTRPNGAYCLNKGKVKIYKIGTHGKEQIIRFVLPGELFGLSSVVCDKNYTTTAVTIEDCLVCIIPKHDFINLLDKFPQL